MNSSDTQTIQWLTILISCGFSGLLSLSISFLVAKYNSKKNTDNQKNSEKRSILHEILGYINLINDNLNYYLSLFDLLDKHPSSGDVTHQYCFDNITVCNFKINEKLNEFCEFYLKKKHIIDDHIFDKISKFSYDSVNVLERRDYIFKDSYDDLINSIKALPFF